MHLEAFSDSTNLIGATVIRLRKATARQADRRYSFEKWLS